MAVSFAGCDLSFMKTPQSKAFLRKAKSDRSKRREDRRAEYNSRKRSDLECPSLMRDIAPFISPIDRKVISSRSGLRRHNRTHRVDQCGEVPLEDYVSHIDKQNDVSDINPNEVSFEWIPNDKA